MKQSLGKLLGKLRWWTTSFIWITTVSASNHPSPLSAKGVPSPRSHSKTQSQPFSCPANIKLLTAELLRDLPSYANRVSQRSRQPGIPVNISSSVIAAGSAEFAPLTLGPGERTSAVAVSPSSSEPQQVFFTTLERQYTAGKAVELEQYHWLFLASDVDGWQLATMFSQSSSYPVVKPPSPPRESSNGVIGQAVRNWLRDCRAGSLRVLPARAVPRSLKK